MDDNYYLSETAIEKFKYLKGLKKLKEPQQMVINISFLRAEWRSQNY